MEYNVHIRKLVSILFHTKQSLDILRLKSKYNNISVNASLFFERERERESSGERAAEREDARREFDVPPSLTDTYISGDSSLPQSAFKTTAHRHFCFGIAHCFELRLSEMANYVIVLWSMRKKEESIIGILKLQDRHCLIWTY